jgi:5-methylcytosine-specific restriction endonuclease McrA
METKQIILFEKEEKKEIQPKEIKKRKITTNKKWTFTPDDLSKTNDLLSDPSKISFIHQQIKNKLYSYRSQDIEKKILDETRFADLSGVLVKLIEAKYSCYYCREPVQLLYENVRDPKQWTLERIDNKLGHILSNVEIACLSCNLRRRTMKPERYILTKNIRTVIKSSNENI